MEVNVTGTYQTKDGTPYDMINSAQAPAGAFITPNAPSVIKTDAIGQIQDQLKLLARVQIDAAFTPIDAVAQPIRYTPGNIDPQFQAIDNG